MVFACYLLTPRGFKRRVATFMGTTVDPERTLREHNGEEGDGVESTLARRPWDMVCVVHGFENELAALEFDWAWHHPLSNKHTRKRLKELQGDRGYGTPASVRRRLVEMYEMLRLDPWDKMALSVSYTSEEFHNWGRELGIYYRWTANKECNTRTLDYWKELATRQEPAVLEDEAARLQSTALRLEDIGGRVEILPAIVATENDNMQRTPTLCARSDQPCCPTCKRPLADATHDNSEQAVWGALPPSLSSPPGPKRRRREPATSPTTTLAAVVGEPATSTTSPLANTARSMVRGLDRVPVSAQNTLGNPDSASGSREGSTGSMSVQRRDPGEGLSENGGAGGDTGVPAQHQLRWPDKLLDAMLCMRFTEPTIAATIERATSNGLEMAAWQHIATRLSGMARMRFSEQQVRAKFASAKGEYDRWSEGHSDEQRRALGLPPPYMPILRRWFGEQHDRTPSTTPVARP